LLNCPRCQETLVSKDFEIFTGNFCEKCQGIFVDHDNIEDFISKNIADSAYAYNPSKLASFSLKADGSIYLKCPVCQDMMQRNNFSKPKSSKKSGILLDSCRIHGIWFDQGEIVNVAEFIRCGGLAV